MHASFTVQRFKLAVLKLAILHVKLFRHHYFLIFVPDMWTLHVRNLVKLTAGHKLWIYNPPLGTLHCVLKSSTLNSWR